MSRLLDNHALPLRALIADDEPLARELARMVLEQLRTPRVEVVYEAQDVEEAVEAIPLLRPDVLLLDIDMPRISGLKLPEMIDLEAFQCALVFLTAYQEHALQAFELAAVDYLLKPLQPEQVARTMLRIARQRTAYASLRDRMDALREALRPEFHARRIALPLMDGLEMQKIDNILYLKAASNYTRLFRTDGPPLLVCKTTKEFQALLAEYPAFFRTHRSYLVNLEQVKTFLRTDGGHLRMTDGAEIPVAKELRDALVNALSALRFP